MKKILIGLAVIVLLLLIIAYLLPRHMHVERSMTMNAPAEIIFEQVNNLKNWDKWSPWHKMDTTMKITYQGPESGKGASYSWDGEEMGTGKLTIAESVPYDSIVNEMYFMEDEKPAYSRFKIARSDSGNVVTWMMDSDAGMNPVKRWFGLFMKGMLEEQFDKGLADIRKVAESMPKTPEAPEVKIEATTSRDQLVLTIKDSASLQEISQKLGALYGEIVGEMKAGGADFAGQPFAIYHSFSHERIVLEAGIPVNKPIKPGAKSRVKAWEMKGGNVVLAHHYGKYEATEQTHYKIDEWVKKNNKTIIGAPWEVYVTDPMKEPDTMKWYTQVYYPIQ
jgi:effector-binding domain-containing protein